MQRVAAQGRVVFLDFQLFRLELLVARGGVARRGLAFLARFGAFDGDDFAWHNYSFSLGFSSGFFFFGFNFGHADGIHRAERAEAALAQGAFAFQLRLRLDGEARPGNRFQPRFGESACRSVRKCRRCSSQSA